MKDTALYFLYKVASRAIPQNQFAKAIYNRFKNAGDNVDVESWELLEIPFDEKTQLEEFDIARIERNKDYRFRYLYLKGFRKFPSPSGGEFYGIPFCSDNSGEHAPESTLLQGGNGTGKTSVFGAMEYLFTGKMSAAYKQGFQTQARLNDFIPFAGEKVDEFDINVLTCTMPFGLRSNDVQQKDLLRLCLLPFFCSECDVDKVIDEGIDTFVYEQMGYTLARNIIWKLGEELKNTSKRYESLEEKTTEGIEALIGDLDKQVVMYGNLKSSFVSLASNVSNETNPKLKLKELNDLFSKKYVQKPLDELSDNEKALIKDDLIAEKKWLGRVLGRMASSQYLFRLYSQIIKALHSKPGKADEFLNLSKVKKENLTQILDEFNYARASFLQIVNELINKDEIPDVATSVNKYEAFLQKLSNDLLQAETRKQNTIKVLSIMGNRKVYDEFLDEYKTEVYDALNNLTLGSRELVNDVMKMFTMDDEEMNMEFDEKSGEFKMNISFRRKDGKKFPFSPEQYLNTFRFKLFCMTLKMAIAFAMKRFYKINFPIVIDDVFYSSDFAHRSMVKDFFRLLFLRHGKLFDNEGLQVILLTHDDVVIEAAFRGICDVIGCSDINRRIMFDYRECDGPETMTMPFKGSNGKPEVVKMIKLAYS